MLLASPFLYKGITLAILKSLITLPVERERLNICESAMIIISRDFSNLSGISSKPALSFDLLFISIFFTSMCSNSSPAMLGCHSNFQTLVKKKYSDAIGTHCTIHH